MKNLTTVIPLQKADLEIGKLFGLLIVVITFGWLVAKLPWPYQAFLPLVPVTLLLAVVAFYEPKWLVWLTLGLLFFGNRTEILALGFWGRYLPTLGVIGLIGITVVRQFVLRKRKHNPRKLLIFGYTLFVVLLLVSALYNGTGTQEIIQGLVTNLRYPLFFMALVKTDLSPKFYQRVIDVFLALTLLQIPISILQFFALGITDDNLGGTMGSNQALVAVVLFSQILLMARWLVNRKKHYLFAMMALFLPYLLADVRIGLIFFPLWAIFMLSQHYGVRKLVEVAKWSVVITLLTVIVVAAIGTLMATTGRFYLLSGLDSYLNPDYYTDPLFVNRGSIGRLTILNYSLPLLFEDEMRIFIGFGPEAAQGGLITGTFSSALDVETGASGVICRTLAEARIKCRESQSFKSLMEYGFLGTLLYFIPLVSQWRRSSWQLRKNGFSVESQVLWLFFQGAGFFYIFLAFWYIGVWRMDSYSLMFWLVAAAVDSKSRHLGTPFAKDSEGLVLVPDKGGAKLWR